MPNFPTVEKTVESLLNTIIALSPSEREAKAKPFLQTFISHPTIQQLLKKDDDPVHIGEPCTNTDLSLIQKSLAAISKAVESLKKGHTNSKNTTPSSCSAQQKSKNPSKPPSHLYSAIARSRAPNPSLVVNLEIFKFTVEARPTPKAICCKLNQQLSGISPSQV